MKSLLPLKLTVLCVLFFISTSHGDVITIAKKGKGQIKLHFKVESTPSKFSILLKEALKKSGYFKIGKTGAYEVSLKEIESGAHQLKISEHGQVIPKGYFQQKITGVKDTQKSLIVADTIIEKILGKGKAFLRSRIAFSAIGADGHKEIYSIDPLGKQLKKITNYKTITVEPEWSPNNKLMNYVVYAGNQVKFVQREMSSGKHRVLTRFNGLNSSAAFSPDGKYLAMTLSKDKQIDLYYLSANNTKKGGRLTTNGDVEASPVWSPDSRSILYVSSRIYKNGKIGRPLLHILNTKTKKTKRLFTDGIERVSPSWSSKTGKIAYAKKMGGKYVIAVCNPNDPAQSEEVILKLAGYWEAPSWAPNGRHLVCTREINGRRELYIIDSISKQKRKISLDLKKCSLPDWSSLR